MFNFLQQWALFVAQRAWRRSADEALRGMKGPSDLARINTALLSALAIGFIIILVRYAGDDAAVSAIACMWAASCLVSGAAVGFLFGIPRVVQGHGEGRAPPKYAGRSAAGTAPPSVSAGDAPDSSSYRQEVNSNLVEISDWLTKIIVGLGLVNLKSVPHLLDDTTLILARGLTGHTAPCKPGAAQCDAYAFATALIVGFSLLGFFMGYLYTRLYLAGAFSRADRLGPESALLASSDRVIREEKIDSAERGESTGATPEARADPDAGPVAGWQLRAAERISKLPEAQNIAATVVTLRQVGSEYDLLRASRSPGNIRTGLMGAIVIRMRGLALAGLSQIAQFADSASSGNRLVAVVMLQMQPDPAYFQWLVDRINLEEPFIVYQAVHALLRAADIRDQRHRPLLRQLLIDWVKTDKAREVLSADTDRTPLLKSLLDHLDISI